MLARGPLPDNQLRAFVSQHIETADVPHELLTQEDVDMYTMNFAFEHQPSGLCLPDDNFMGPHLLRQLMDFCSRPWATSFEEPIVDGTGARVRFLSLDHMDWQHTLEVTLALGHRIREDAEMIACRDPPQP